MSSELQEIPKQFPTIKEMSGWVYELLRAKPYGATVTYGELSAVLTLPAQEHRGRHAVLMAGRRLLVDHDKLLVNVKNTGYRVAEPREHSKQSRRFAAQGRRRMRRALVTVAHVALEALTPEERAAVLADQVRHGLALAFAQRIARRKALPPKEQIALPSGPNLVRLLTRKSG